MYCIKQQKWCSSHHGGKQEHFIALNCFCFKADIAMNYKNVLKYHKLLLFYITVSFRPIRCS